MNSILRLRDINKSYEGHVILHGLSLEIFPGESYAVVGKSGAGKSTLLNIMGLLEKPDQGEISYFGEVIHAGNKRKIQKILREQIGYLFQNYALVEEETVRYNIGIGLQYRNDLRSKSMRAQEIQHLLRIVGMEGMEERKIFSLSGGEQQRIALARVLGKPCSVILADEPTGNLDIENSKQVIRLLMEQTKGKKAIVVVTHDRSFLPAFDHVIELS